MEDLTGFRVAIIASDGFEQSELVEPMNALRKANAEVTIVTTQGEEIQGFQHFDKGERIKADRTLKEIDADEFDGVVLPGGTLNADFLRMDEDLQDLLRAFQADQKPIAAICHAPWELVSAGLVQGRTLTSYYTIQDDITNAGGNWIDEEVVTDENLVTSRQPEDLPAFNKAMVELFAKYHSEGAESGRQIQGNAEYYDSGESYY